MFERLYALARYQGVTDELPPQRQALWETLAGAAMAVCHQLFIKNADSGLDWWVKRHWGRVGLAEGLFISYWMTLYFLARFREKGAQGYSTVEEFPALCATAERWISSVANSVNVSIPPPWSETWASDERNVAAKSLFDAVYYCLHLPFDQIVRVARVAWFSVSADLMYDVAVGELT